MANVEINGECDPRFEKVRKAFADNFDKLGEIGASAAVVLDGNQVVDLWAGHADKAKSRLWERDTIVNVYSTTKGLTAICAHRLVDQGKLDLDEPVARYWPEFAQAGKKDLPVRFILSHRAGLPAIKKPLPANALFEWDTMCEALAEQEPWWKPGEKHGYHALTFGWLVGELVRRISGKRSLGTFFRDEIADALNLDCHIGLEAKHDARTADMIAAPLPAPGQPNLFADLAKDPESMTAKAFANPPTMMRPSSVNTREWRAAEIPAANAHTTARALARLYGALARGGEVDGVRVLKPESIERCHTEQSLGNDAVLQIVSTRFSYGFMMSQPGAQLGPNPTAFGHPGAGGSIGFADPQAKIGFGYTMNKMEASLLIDPRATAMINAVYASL